MKNSSKYLTLLISVAIPLISMLVTTNYMTLTKTYSQILTSFTGGLLLMSGFGILNEIFEKKNKFGFIGFIISILFLYFTNLQKTTILESFYFDSFSDGLLLGALLNKENIQTIVPLLIGLSLEMSITSISVVNKLKSEKEKDPKWKTSLGAIILSVSVIFGYFISNYINKNLIEGLGSASMIWLSISSFLKNTSSFNLIFVFVGIIVGNFLE